MYVYVCVCVCMCVYVCVCANVYICTYIQDCIGREKALCVSVFMYVHTYDIRIYVCMQPFIFACIDVKVHAFVYVCVCIYIYIYIYIIMYLIYLCMHPVCVQSTTCSVFWDRAGVSKQHRHRQNC